ncbi:MAG: M20/M25/M40 family metallo-hydrolase [Planctomycetota bacterium]
MARTIPLRLRLALAALLGLLVLGGCSHRSPGVLYQSDRGPLTPAQLGLWEELRADVQAFSREVGPRSAAGSLPKLLDAERWLLARLRAEGMEPERDEVLVNGVMTANVLVTFPGTESPDEILLLGAHYDTVPRSPGANDNASGVALLFALARRLRDDPAPRTVRLAFFVNEEPPFTGGILMGSRVYAERCAARGDDIVLMVSVDSVGYYTSEADSQGQPYFFYGLPEVGNFIAFASDEDHEPLLDRVVSIYQSECRFPSVGIVSTAASDHGSFLRQGFPALLLTDTREARDPHSHKPTDVADNLNYDDMARMAEGFLRMVRVLAAAGTELSVDPR